MFKFTRSSIIFRKPIINSCIQFSIINKPRCQHFSGYFREPKPNKYKLWIKSIVGSPFIIYGLYKIYVDFTGGNKPIIVNYMEFEPVPLPESDEEIRLLENKRVILRGHFDHSSEILVGPCQNLNAKKVDFMGEVWPIGYHLFTPFTLSDSGRRILVNRGYVSNLLKDPSRRMLGQVEDEITFNAIVELQSNINTVQRLVSHSLKNDWIYDNVFKRIDMELFSRKLNIDPIAIFVADKESTLRNGPIGGQIQSSYDSELLSAAFPVVSLIIGIIIFIKF